MAECSLQAARMVWWGGVGGSRRVLGVRSPAPPTRESQPDPMQCFTVIQPLNPFQKQEKTLPLLSLKGVLFLCFKEFKSVGAAWSLI